MENKKNSQELKQTQDKEKAYDNKFMTNWAENEPPQHFAGDEQTDDFTNDNDYDKNLDLRMTSPMGGTFMHPMHDATLDVYKNELNFIVNQPDSEKDSKKKK
ncbi:hypothetical protein [Tepidibacillus marianensis]|uniref:hypothetical protein n=1 Tax=Tepidibacillus marianensis TaxID=3131995 RepID=UPI0030D4CDA6